MRCKPLAVALAGGLMAFAQAGIASALRDADAVPHLDPSGREAYRQFLAAGGHRAFAIAPGGVWTWKSDAPSPESVADDALQTCESESGRSCLLYALDDRVVFDAKAWARLWGPYLDRTAAAASAVGRNRGERFYDLTFTNPAGKRMKLSDLRGSIVVLHFWGSWCPPCKREMPELQRLRGALGKSRDIQVVLLQVREEIAEARAWARQQQVRLPLYDSGATDELNDTLALADGRTIHDRSIAEVFPTTYVLDKHGVVLFSHFGPIADWSAYLPLLRDAARRSGK